VPAAIVHDDHGAGIETLKQERVTLPGRRAVVCDNPSAAP